MHFKLIDVSTETIKLKTMKIGKARILFQPDVKKSNANFGNYAV